MSARRVRNIDSITSDAEIIVYQVTQEWPIRKVTVVLISWCLGTDHEEHDEADVGTEEQVDADYNV